MTSLQAPGVPEKEDGGGTGVDGKNMKQKGHRLTRL
jgi:hypothetical protein